MLGPPELMKMAAVDRWTLLDRALDSVSRVGCYLEFGVFKGKTARRILRKMPADRLLFLFDSFCGLPERWTWGDQPGQMIERGAFNLGGKAPNLQDERCRYVVGDFADTVEPWIQEWPDVDISFIHIDCDLYTSARDCLLSLVYHGMIRPGCIIMFDEIQGFARWKEGEWKALVETGLEYTWLGRSTKFRAALRVI